MREYLECLCPLDDGDPPQQPQQSQTLLTTPPPTTGDQPTLRDTLAAPYADRIGLAAGLSPLDIRLIDRKLQRNQMDLKMRSRGELLELGSGVFPFSALFNHSCHRHAQWRPIANGTAISSWMADAMTSACGPLFLQTSAKNSSWWICCTTSIGFPRKRQQCFPRHLGVRDVWTARDCHVR